jgi:hypothetical protein
MDDNPSPRVSCGHTVGTLFDLMDERERFQMERIGKLEAVGTERDLRYKEKFDAQEKAVKISFDSSEKAVQKAEDAQKEYNVRSNEFRSALDDQQKTLLTRNEADTRFTQIRELVDAQGAMIGTIQNVLSRTEGIARTIDGGKANNLVVFALLATLALVVIEGVGLLFVILRH